MTVAVITLAVTALGLGGGLVLAIRYAIDAHRAAQNARDLYNAQLDVKHELETDIRELVGKLAATDTQLREAKARIAEVERQRNKAVEEAKEYVRREIRNAPDAIAALNKILAAGPAGAAPAGVRREDQAGEAKAAAPQADAGGGGADPLLAARLL